MDTPINNTAVELIFPFHQQIRHDLIRVRQQEKHSRHIYIACRAVVHRLPHTPHPISASSMPFVCKARLSHSCRADGPESHPHKKTAVLDRGYIWICRTGSESPLSSCYLLARKYSMSALVEESCFSSRSPSSSGRISAAKTLPSCTPH